MAAALVPTESPGTRQHATPLSMHPLPQNVVFVDGAIILQSRDIRGGAPNQGFDGKFAVRDRGKLFFGGVSRSKLQEIGNGSGRQAACQGCGRTWRQRRLAGQKVISPTFHGVVDVDVGKRLAKSLGHRG